MTDTFKGIITADGKKRQLPYGSVLETPVSDETLSTQGGFADAKVVGDKFKEVKAETDSLKGDLVDLYDNLIKRKNLLSGIEEGKYYIAWNVGDTPTFGNAENYACGIIDVAGIEKISLNIEVSGTYSFFCDSDNKKIASFADCVVSSKVYSVPNNAIYAYISCHDKKNWSAYGIIVVNGEKNISNASVTDYPYGESLLFLDPFKLTTGKSIKEEIDTLKNSKGGSEVESLFKKVKNLCTDINKGKYYIAWNVGDSPTLTDGANYACGIADVSGISKISINNTNVSGGYSHFCDANGNKLYDMSDYKIGSTSVFNVPPDAKYAYVTVNNKNEWDVYGLVILDTDEDIATFHKSSSDYPYGEEKYFADTLPLENGSTVGNVAKYANHVFYVEKDGSGDFTSFVEAINTACQYMNSIVYVGAGTYDLLDELGDEYISSASSQKNGIVLKNRVHVICSAQTILSMDYDGSLSNAKEWLSPINTGVYGCILENATIIDNNVRYSVHDDQGWSGSIQYTNKFINCTLIHKNGMYGDCIGGGLGENCNIEIRGCYLEGDVNVERLAYYHGNNHAGIINAKGNIIVCDNYFANKGAFWINKYGDSTEMTTALVSNNSFGSEPKVVTSANAQDNMRMIAWNNEIRS